MKGKDWTDTQICNSHPLYLTVLFNAQHPPPHTQHTLRWSQEQQGCSVLKHLQPGPRELQCPLTTRERKETGTHTPPRKEEEHRQCCRLQHLPSSGTEQSSSSGSELITKTGVLSNLKQAAPINKSATTVI